MSLVIDASITLSWFFKDERTAASRVVFDEVLDNGATVPLLWRYEVANSLQMAVRRQRIAAVDRDETLADFRDIEISVDLEGGAFAWSNCVQLADRHGLTIYDAAYLELAQRRRMTLATLDAALIGAARAELVPVVGS
jgi:predicted nucleic acid-binding protein